MGDGLARVMGRPDARDRVPGVRDRDQRVLPTRSVISQKASRARTARPMKTRMRRSIRQRPIAIVVGAGAVAGAGRSRGAA